MNRSYSHHAGKVLCLSVIIILSGCARYKYPGWQQVRIEYELPDESCQYKIQDSCQHASNRCFQWYKQRATRWDANTVVITPPEGLETKQTVTNTKVSVTPYDLSLALAEYYYCPSK